MGPMTVLAGLFFLQLSFAFVPDENYGKFTFTKSRFHSTITQNALNRVFVNYLQESPRCKANISQLENNSPEQTYANCFGSGSSPAKFLQARSEIITGNGNTDKNSATKNNPLYHFDDEKILETNEGLWRRMRDFWSVLTTDSAQECSTARRLLGEVLHTLQDFYSHTNWVELGNKDINYEVAAPSLQRIRAIGPLAGPKEPTCKDCQDPGLFRAFTCENNIITKNLTSGYYLSVVESAMFWEGNKSPKPTDVAKCSHGGSIDASTRTPPIGGINKDSTNAFLSPHYYLHNQAADFAENATVHFFKQLIFQADDGALGCFFGLDVTALAFVMDTTTSMKSYIQAAIELAKLIVQPMKGEYDAPSLYVLVPFNDPGYGPANTTRDPNEFQQQLNSLSLGGGGGDIPEMCYHGIYLAEQEVMKGSPIFVFTDAPPKDAYMHDLVLAVAQYKKVLINFLLGGTIGATEQPVATGNGTQPQTQPTDNDFDEFYTLAMQSGGLVIRTTGSQEDILKLSVLFRTLMNAATVLIYRIDKREGPLTMDKLPVDITMSSFSVVITTDRPSCIQSMNLTDPNGKGYDTSKMQLTQMTYMVVVSGADLVPGLWSLHISACESCCRYTVLILGQSTAALMYSLTEYQADSPHPSYQPIVGNPLIGTTLLLVIDTTSPKVNFTHIDILDADNGNANKASFPLEYALEGDYHYFSNVTVPNFRFKFQAHGVDVNGYQVIRQSMGIIQPTRVSVTADAVGDTGSRGIVQGHVLLVNVTIKNHGPAGQFNLSAEDTRGFAEVHSQKLTVGEGETVHRTITLRAPADARPGSVSIVHVIVSAANATGDAVQLTVPVLATEADMAPPVCIILSSNYEEKCKDLAQKSCQTVQWEANTVFRDDGLGLYRVFPQASGGQFKAKVEPFQKYLAHKNVTANLTGDCCVENVNLIVVDVLGQTASCSMERGKGPISATPAPPKPQPVTVEPAATTTTILIPTTEAVARVTLPPAPPTPPNVPVEVVATTSKPAPITTTVQNVPVEAGTTNKPVTDTHRQFDKHPKDLRERDDNSAPVTAWSLQLMALAVIIALVGY